MMVLFWALVAATAVAVGIIGLGRFAHWDNDRIMRLNEHARAFFKAADGVLSTDDVPAELIWNIKFFAWVLRQPPGPKLLLRTLSKLETKKDRTTADNEVHIEDPVTDELMHEVFIHVFLAISYQSRFYGPRIRTALAELFATKESIELVRTSFSFASSATKQCDAFAVRFACAA